MKFKLINPTNRPQVLPSMSGGTQGTEILVLDVNSYAWSWGYGQFGQLGNNALQQSYPILVSNQQWKQLIIGGEQGAVLGVDMAGYAWEWGNNQYGGLGNNSTINTSSPVSVLGGYKWQSFAMTSTLVGALDINSYAWSWGAIGGTAVPVSSPVSVRGGRQFTQLIANSYANNGAILGLDANSYAWTWGGNQYGGLGNNTQAASNSPVSVVGNRRWRSIAAAATTGSVFYGLDTNSYAWSWGENGQGYLGNNTINNNSSPVSVVGNRQFTKIFANVGDGWAAYALDGNGYAWSWGYNSKGQLGNNSVSSASSPVSVVGGIQFTAILPGGQTIFGLTANGVLWGWGNNSYGQFGVSNTISQSSPVSIMSGVSLANLTVTDDSAVYLFSGSTLWGWGGRNGGGVGDGTTAYRSSPVSIVTSSMARGPATVIYGM